MGEKKIAEQFTGRDLVDHCTSTLNIRPTMLAALLNVTERTLANWNECPYNGDYPVKFERLRTFDRILSRAEAKRIDYKIFLNLLNEPIPGDEDERTLLHYIVDEPTNPLLNAAADSVIELFK